MNTYIVVPNGGKHFTVTCKGRDEWALLELIQAGEDGVTPVSRPAGPRWSAYIFNLRAMGITIDTLHEQHGGHFPGTHARYVLRATVQPASREAAE